MKNFEAMKLKDRDAIIGSEGIIFRVLGYLHPPEGYVCEPEYAPRTIFKSANPRAPRGYPDPSYFKFYGDEGLKFVEDSYPVYRVYFKPLRRHLVGVPRSLIAYVRRPREGLTWILEAESRDKLMEDVESIIDMVYDRIGLKPYIFGVFGSLLHRFHHPKLSDIDLTVYGGVNTGRLRRGLAELYREKKILRNEFEKPKVKRRWLFKNYSLREYILHERRKLLYAEYWDGERWVKVEFEPVKDVGDPYEDYRDYVSIDRVGWVKLKAEVVDDREAYFTPSIYKVETLEVLEGPREAYEASRVVSYVDEFRIQAWRGEKIYVEGFLERVERRSRVEYQVSLSYNDRYFDQVLKVEDIL